MPGQSMAIGHGSGTDLAYTVAAFLGWRDLLALGASARFLRPVTSSLLIKKNSLPGSKLDRDLSCSAEPAELLRGRIPRSVSSAAA